MKILRQRPNIVGETKVARLNWLGHVDTMGKNYAECTWDDLMDTERSDIPGTAEANQIQSFIVLCKYILHLNVLTFLHTVIIYYERYGSERPNGPQN